MGESQVQGRWQWCVLPEGGHAFDGSRKEHRVAFQRCANLDAGLFKPLTEEGAGPSEPPLSLDHRATSEAFVGGG